MKPELMIDHLFRHEYGKMVSSLTRIYGIANLDLIEDAVQDTFQKAVLYFRNNELPENPEGWLRTVAKNRAIDLFRKVSSQNKYENISGTSFITMQEVFTDHEIEDSQLRLLFTICHPSLKLKDQIIFALKTFSGFSRKEIAAALMISQENVKKSLFRARKNIDLNQVKFEVPSGEQFKERIASVHLAIYLLFNEGFHSSNKEKLIKKDLIAEALRLNGLLIDRFDLPESKAMMAMMCFHAARLEAKISDDNHLIKLKHQERQKWNFQLILKGHQWMEEAVETDEYTRFHWEAAIAGEYINARTYEETDWAKLEIYHRNLILLLPTASNFLNLAVILNQQGKTTQAKETLESIDLENLKGREYLFYSVFAEIYSTMKDYMLAREMLTKALNAVNNISEKSLILQKLQDLPS
ncbi:DNA-directed RNA polymerase sigma-70 factor [Portibacter lacus]|uniref:DNA-directed RNA polymerase sigma-70 factor n=2 Tax=Portibacter lacus TaxID=1099794 RepID=A0AA37SRE5_9BACT|nr:DNA-directed RNA polymerase sigma-70 factor [Portibacter lacus]